MVVAGFTPVELLSASAVAVRWAVEGCAEVYNAYPAVVREEGNPVGRELVRRVFEVCDREWRGLGRLAKSGLSVGEEFAAWDAERRFPELGEDFNAEAQRRRGGAEGGAREGVGCPAAQVLLGRMEPTACLMFGRECTPASPQGAPMVSPEGACAAYYWHKGKGLY